RKPSGASGPRAADNRAVPRRPWERRPTPRTGPEPSAGWLRDVESWCGSLLLRRRRIVAARRSGKHAAAVGHLDRPRVAGLRAVLRKHAVDRDRVADFQGIRAPAISRQRVG